ncbi:unnamed protein product [Peronospora belbahrii]|uniref:PSI domain-containing protein n=1 Tax=Peronospora belbahrii TaxID=622444 RepID=A0AAU9KSQ6_9STRA|nr:unnamed protein product [Peronospora belbahrii]CAH0521592.1 unnamed protein product [Peronospora belbahrii]
MKVKKVFVVLVTCCVTIGTLVRGREEINEATGERPSRHLRQETSWFTSALIKAGIAHNLTNPLQHRDKALVSAHRIYDPASGLACYLVGDCMSCYSSERDESFCRETGYRQELDCPLPWDPKDKSPLAKRDHGRQTRYKACRPADTVRPGLAVVKFEAVMVVLLVVSVVLLRRERRNHMSLFDRRKDPHQCGGLLNGPATGNKSSD